MIDTNALIYLNQYTPRDIHPSIWRAFEKLIAEDRALIPRDAYDELGRVDDGLSPWAKALSGFVAEPTIDDIHLVAEISDAHPDWVNGQKNAADPWVIAQAKRLGAHIVTNERARGPNAADANLGIPNVASEHGVDCINLNALGRREGWRF